jgi:hypothetical protein
LGEDRKRRIADLEREMKAKYEAAGIEFTPFTHAVEQQPLPPSNPGETTEQPNAVPDTNVDTIEQPNTVPDTIVELIETEKPKADGAITVEIRLPSTVKAPSTVVDQPIQKLLPSVFSRAHPESELIDEEEACAGVRESTIDALPGPLQAMASLYVQKARLAPESGEELMDQKAACTVETFDDVIGDYAFPARRVLPTDRPPPNSGHPFEVWKDRASPKSTEELIDEKHACVLEAVLGEYAFPTLLFVPTDRPPPKPGEAPKLLAPASTTTTRRTIKLKACRSGEAGEHEGR